MLDNRHYRKSENRTGMCRANTISNHASHQNNSNHFTCTLSSNSRSIRRGQDTVFQTQLVRAAPWLHIIYMLSHEQVREHMEVRIFLFSSTAAECVKYTQQLCEWGSYRCQQLSLSPTGEIARSSVRSLGPRSKLQAGGCSDTVMLAMPTRRAEGSSHTIGPAYRGLLAVGDLDLTG